MAEGSKRFSVAEKNWASIMRFSAGLERSRAKARPFGMNCFSAGLKSSSPLLKQGAPTRFGVDDIGGLFSGSHAELFSPCRDIRQGLKPTLEWALRHD